MTIPISLQDTVVLFVCLSTVAALRYTISQQATNTAASSSSLPEGYILRNRVTHTRLLPVESSHSFTYPTISVLVSIDALEQGRLNILRGLFFGYGSTLGRLLSLRSKPYLERGCSPLRQKLIGLLTARGHLTANNPEFKAAWMMTMPSVLGFEGINPLTVYFCYREDTLWLVVLEIHNTFGETHAHVLEIGCNEDPSPSSGFDHQWTFRREFHVSPFNDRTGFYTVAVRAPSHSPTSQSLQPVDPPRPVVRIHLHTAAANLSSDDPKPGPLKLTAVLRPLKAEPLNAYGITSTLLWAPGSLFLSLPRILLEAWKLHYRKRLDVFIRPEPFAPVDKRLLLKDTRVDERTGGGIAWRSESAFEAFARRRVQIFLQRRVVERQAAVILIPFDPASKPSVFGNLDLAIPEKRLTIHYSAPRVFTILFLSPSARHAYLLGCETEGVFHVSSKALFFDIFADETCERTRRRSLRQTLRVTPILPGLSLPVPHSHALDQKSPIGAIVDAAFIWTSLLFERLETLGFRLASARVVPGDEPWKQWERANSVLQGDDAGKHRSSLGSISREY